MNRLLIASWAMLIVLVWMLTPGRSEKDETVEEFMRAKLIHSQNVVEGLTTEDFDQIAKSSQEMSLLSQAAQWQVLQTPEYVRRSGEFRRAVDKLTQAGKDKNLDGALLSYVDVTMKCVECHKYIRSVRNARLDDWHLPDAPITAVGD